MSYIAVIFCGGRSCVETVEDYLELSGHRISYFCDPWWILVKILMIYSI